MKVDFFIVGAPKAGTTSLYHYLNEHPKIVMSTQKETDFFSDESLQKQAMYYGKNRINTIEKYHALFQNTEKEVLGEASVSYLFYDDVPKKIKIYNPNGKIIILLRNPIDRAFSHYLMDYRLGLVSQSFDEIVGAKNKDEKTKLFYQQYIELGMYYQQVKRYLDVFGKENICILFYQDFKQDGAKEVKNIYQFLGVESNFEAEVGKKHNTFSMPKNAIVRKIYSVVWLRKLLNKLIPSSIIKTIKTTLFRKDKKPKLSEESRLELYAVFNEDVKQLEELLAKDLSRWRK